MKVETTFGSYLLERVTADLASTECRCPLCGERRAKLFGVKYKHPQSYIDNMVHLDLLQHLRDIHLGVYTGTAWTDRHDIWFVSDDRIPKFVYARMSEEGTRRIHIPTNAEVVNAIQVLNDVAVGTMKFIGKLNTAKELYPFVK